MIDITNNKYYRLTAIKRLENIGKEPRWLFRCDCGKDLKAYQYNVTSGKTQSCGCYHKEQTSKATFKHGGIKLPEYRVWDGIIQRVTNKKNLSYSNYGGRGIKICDRWFDFSNFYEDMGARPSSKHSIDRIDNSGNYEPSNCKWSTPTEQNNNRRDNKLLEFNGNLLTIPQYASASGLTYFTVYQRIRRKQMQAFKGKILEEVRKLEETK